MDAPDLGSIRTELNEMLQVLEEDTGASNAFQKKLVEKSIDLLDLVNQGMEQGSTWQTGLLLLLASAHVRLDELETRSIFS